MKTGKIIAIIHARITSSRLPGKVIMDLCGKSVFYHHVERLRQCPVIEEIVLATSKNAANTPLVEEAKTLGLDYYRGAEEDVVERYITIADRKRAQAVVRTGCDKPLLSYEIVDSLLDQYAGEDVLYVDTPLSRGVGSEVISRKALKKIHRHYHGPAITKYVFEYPHLFHTRGIEVDDELSRPEFRLTLDTEDDFRLIAKLYEEFYLDGCPVDLRDVFRYLDDNPTLANINRFVEEKEVNKYVKDLEREPVIAIYRRRDGFFVIKNRMGEVIPRKELETIMTKIIPEV